jgi:hypothetical protein
MRIADLTADFTAEGPWYGAKCLFLHRDATGLCPGRVYEQRIVLVRASSQEAAIRAAEANAREYADDNDAVYLGFVDTFHIFSENLGDGTEVYSLMQTSQLERDEFVSKYFDDGTQHSQATAVRRRDGAV